MIPDRYQSRPSTPEQVEAVLLSEDNLADVVDWLNTFTATRPRLQGRDATIQPDPDSGGRRIMSPFFGGWYGCRPGDYLVHFGSGEARSMSAEDFQVTYEPAPPSDPSMCSCLNGEAYGHAEGDEPMRWDPDCKRCGRTLSAPALAQAAKAYR